MRVLGVDPGLGRTGVGIVDGEPGRLRLVHAACLDTPADLDDARRLHLLSTMLSAVIAEHRPQVAAVERLFFSTNRTTAMRVSEARGVLLCALAAAAVDTVEYTPNEVKESVAGYGGARKQQVTRMVSGLLGVERIAGPDDVADACAVAICHHHRAAMTRQLPGARAQRGAPTALDLAVAAARERLAAVQP